MGLPAQHSTAQHEPCWPQVPAPLDASPEAAHTAAVVDELSREMQALLVRHPINAARVAAGKNPANVVLLRGCGSRWGCCTPRTQRHGGVVPPFRVLLARRRSGFCWCAAAPLWLAGALWRDADGTKRAARRSAAQRQGGVACGLRAG
jgi:hypothetical protein